LISVRKVSANTVASYTRDVTQLVAYLGDNGKTSISDVTEVDVRDYIANLECNGRSPATISRTIASLKVFFSCLTQDGYFSANPASGIMSVAAEKKSPRLLTDEEIKRLLELPDVSDSKGSRDKAMLETMYATGLRVSELISLDVTDVNSTTGLITCRNGKERIIPVYASAIKAITTYLTSVRVKLALVDETALFVNTNGRRLSRQGLWKILKNYTKIAQINIDITPQMLRNSFAAHLLEKGADLHSLKVMLGHADISSTKVYARAVQNQLKNVYNKAHPKA
jgi:integrase/recombinase XerD